MARPTIFTEELGLDICCRLVEGESLRAICRDESMPGERTVFTWLNKSPEFRQQYAHARELQSELMLDDIRDIADDGTNDWMEKLNRDGEPTGFYLLNKEAVMRSKLRVEVRQWIMARMAPKRFGDKLAMEHTGKDGEAIEVNVTDRDRARALHALMAKLQAQAGK